MKPYQAQISEVKSTLNDLLSGTAGQLAADQRDVMIKLEAATGAEVKVIF